MPFSQDTGRGPFKAVYEAGYGHFRWIVHEQMNMVVLAFKFDQFRLEVLADFEKHLAQVFKNRICEHMSTVFGYKDQMNMEVKYTVPAASDFACDCHTPNYNGVNETTQGF